jgi:hypothetical protein
MKRIDEHHRWRKPTIIDRNPELIAFLKTNPKYQDALALRKTLLWRLQVFTGWKQNEAIPLRESKSLDDFVATPHLHLVR